ncbi:MAG: proteasome accessory factor PafA2 family protein [Chthoniobacteraceae bacterium]
MNRIVGVEIEYGCLVSGEQAGGNIDAWPGRVKNHVFKRMKAGAIDLHYRDYEEPPGNGGFLLNGGRLYMDMGHLEYSTPECRTVRDAVSFEIAGDILLQAALHEMEAADSVAFIKNNVDHHTGATFGCHENYLMRRDVQFHPALLGTLLSFLATRQIFTGAGRVGQASPLAFDFDPPRGSEPVDFQISQRADHIVNDIYQWVQFNRAIINARDEPLADYRKYRRLHLLIGDSNMSPFASALKLGTTALILTLIEEGHMPDGVILRDAVLATRQISHDGTGRGAVMLDDGSTRGALDIQHDFLTHAERHMRGKDEETDWILESWRFTLEALSTKPELLIGGVDWISKKWMLEQFRESENLEWNDPWLQSLDLEYHNIDPAKGLFFGVTPAKAIGEFNDLARREEATRHPPADTRARGRGHAVARFMGGREPYVINWDSISIENSAHLPMPDPFDTYVAAVDETLC